MSSRDSDGAAMIEAGTPDQSSSTPTTMRGARSFATTSTTASSSARCSRPGARSFDPATGAELSTLQKASYFYYPNNRVKRFTDEEGGETDVVYTAHGLPERVTAPLSTGTKRHETSYTYNRRGQVLSAHEEGHTNPTGFGYNLHGERTTVTPPKGNAIPTPGSPRRSRAGVSAPPWSCRG
jgi:YD repeat-containing protein